MWGIDMQKIKSMEMKGITKRFPGVIANKDIDLKVNSGEVFALLGENGAGKTTLMNILYGLYSPDEGNIYINDKKVIIDSPKKALELGIGMVHQHFMLVPSLTVSENIALGSDFESKFRLDLKKISKNIKKLSKDYSLEVEPEKKISELSVGEQQKVEIVKALYHGANFLVLDEPTAALTPQESSQLISWLRTVIKEDMGVIFISHKLNEVMSVSDRVQVLRNGKTYFSAKTKNTNIDELAKNMAGREIKLPKLEAEKTHGDILMELKHIWVKDRRGIDVLKDINLKLREGEILGIAGVSGNGQKDLAEVITGLKKAYKGEIIFGDQNIEKKSVQEIIDLGVGFIPEDRLHMGTIPRFTVKENLILKDYLKNPFSNNYILDQNYIKNYCKTTVEEYDVRCPNINTPTHALSGGNIQKIILSRELKREPDVLVAAYPIRGVDIAAVEYIHSKLLEARENGMAILLITEELEEIMNLSDRIAVIYEGEILRILDNTAASKSKLGTLMAGVVDENK
jgi:simple sugar transport system ATP-binding protein